VPLGEAVKGSGQCNTGSGAQPKAVLLGTVRARTSWFRVVVKALVLLVAMRGVERPIIVPLDSTTNNNKDKELPSEGALELLRWIFTHYCRTGGNGLS
jgi:hypothetical protein